MISDNRTDEFFNDRLRGYQSPVPADMWDRIIEKKKRDRILWLFFFRLLIVGILALGLAGSYLIFNQKKSASTVISGNAKIKPSVPFLTTAAASVKAKTKPTSSVSSSVKPVRANLFSGQDPVVPDGIKAYDKIIHQHKKSGTRSNKAVLNHSVVLENGEENITNNIVSPGGENGSKELFSSTDSSKIENNKSGNENDSLDKKHDIKPVRRDSSGLADIKKPETKKNLPYRKWFLDLYGSVDYPIISFNENQQSELSYTIGIKINRSLGRHLSVKTGIQYSQVNLKGGDSISGGNKLHLMRWDIPALVGYSVGNGDLKTTFNGGAVLNLYSWIRGNTIPDFFKTNTGLSLYLGVNFEKRINEKFSLFAEPYYRYQLTSMTISTISGWKFIDVAGINIGARYYFKK